MIEHLPFFLPLIFALTVLLTLFLLMQAWRHVIPAGSRSKPGLVLTVSIAWLGFQAALTLSGRYIDDTRSFPPAILWMGVLPALLVIALLFILPRGRRFIDALPLYRLSWIHVVRIPVELVLYGLYVYGCVPGLMTFAGYNFDILAGISAPLIAYYVHRRKSPDRLLLLAWNLIGLVLLMNIVVSAVLAAPSPIQSLAFDQPNIAILYFPFSWLPVFVVPVVLFCHLAAIRQLLAARH